MSNSKDARHLIIMGNRNEDAFANTLKALAHHWPTPPIKAVHLFRIQTDQSMPNWRVLCHTLLPQLTQYHEYKLTDLTELTSELPEVLDTLIARQAISPQKVIVDMTNGPKTWTDLVYLVCTLMQIFDLFRIKIPPDLRSVSYQQIKPNQISIKPEPVLEQDDLQRLVRSTYSEYIFYLDEINRFTHWLRQHSILRLNSADVYARLLNTFEHYMRQNYDAAILAAGKLLEEFLSEILHHLEQKFGNHWQAIANVNPNWSAPVPSLGSFAHTLGQVCLRVNYIVAGVNNGFTRSPAAQPLHDLPEIAEFVPMLSTGMHCQSLAMIRNYSGHGGPHNAMLQTETDARKMIHGLLYIFGKARTCSLFQ